MPRRPFTVTRIASFARRLGQARRGSSSVEYGFILAFIFLILFIGVVQMADVTQGMWSDISSRFITAARH
jgi:Flp pilus assembly pilin Flp